MPPRNRDLFSARRVRCFAREISAEQRETCKCKEAPWGNSMGPQESQRGIWISPFSVSAIFVEARILPGARNVSFAEPWVGPHRYPEEIQKGGNGSPAIVPSTRLVVPRPQKEASSTSPFPRAGLGRPWRGQDSTPFSQDAGVLRRDLLGFWCVVSPWG